MIRVLKVLNVYAGVPQVCLRVHGDQLHHRRGPDDRVLIRLYS